MSVTQTVEPAVDVQCRHNLCEIFRQPVRCAHSAVPAGEYEIGAGGASHTELEAEFLLARVMRSQFGNQLRRNCDGALAGFGLRRLDAQAGFGLFHGALDPDRCLTEIDILPAQREDLAAATAGAE